MAETFQNKVNSALADAIGLFENRFSHHYDKPPKTVKVSETSDNQPLEKSFSKIYDQLMEKHKGAPPEELAVASLAIHQNPLVRAMAVEMDNEDLMPGGDVRRMYQFQLARALGALVDPKQMQRPLATKLRDIVLNGRDLANMPYESEVSAKAPLGLEGMQVMPRPQF